MQTISNYFPEIILMAIIFVLIARRHYAEFMAARRERNTREMLKVVISGVEDFIRVVSPSLSDQLKDKVKTATKVAGVFDEVHEIVREVTHPEEKK